jgi:hypothetical protein
MPPIPKDADYTTLAFPVSDLDVMLLRQSHSSVKSVETCAALVGKFSYFYTYAREHNIPVLKVF